MLKGGNVSLRTARYQSLPLNDGHHGWDEPLPTSLEQSFLDAELDATGLATVTVLRKRRRNSVCAISKLPPELLSYVFSMNVLCDRPGMKNGAYSLGWIVTTQVCHQWREVGQAASVR